MVDLSAGQACSRGSEAKPSTGYRVTRKYLRSRPQLLDQGNGSRRAGRATAFTRNHHRVQSDAGSGQHLGPGWRFAAGRVPPGTPGRWGANPSNTTARKVCIYDRSVFRVEGGLPSWAGGVDDETIARGGSTWFRGVPAHAEEGTVALGLGDVRIIISERDVRAVTKDHDRYAVEVSSEANVLLRIEKTLKAVVQPDCRCGDRHSGTSPRAVRSRIDLEIGPITICDLLCADVVVDTGTNHVSYRFVSRSIAGRRDFAVHPGRSALSCSKRYMARGRHPVSRRCSSCQGNGIDQLISRAAACSG